MTKRSINIACGLSLILFLTLWAMGICHPEKLYYRVKFQKVIVQESKRHSLSPYLIAAVIFTESRFRETAESEVGARGLMQLMPATAAEMATLERLSKFHQSSLFEPDINIRLGSRYLSELIFSCLLYTSPSPRDRG